MSQMPEPAQAPHAVAQRPALALALLQEEVVVAWAPIQLPPSGMPAWVLEPDPALDPGMSAQMPELARAPHATAQRLVGPVVQVPEPALQLAPLALAWLGMSAHMPEPAQAPATAQRPVRLRPTLLGPAPGEGPALGPSQEEVAEAGCWQQEV
jgi:hypothetical protein